jgi:hypothetical protein
VLQEYLARKQHVKASDVEASLQPDASKPGGRSRLDLANRLKQRRERRRQGFVPYSGFVPPYNTQSRVFDATELRRAATQVLLGGVVGEETHAHTCVVFVRSFRLLWVQAVAVWLKEKPTMWLSFVPCCFLVFISHK